MYQQPAQFTRMSGTPTCKHTRGFYTDKKYNEFSSYIRKFRGIGCKVIYEKGFLIHTYMRKGANITIYEEAISQK
jgi:hypothetical protein